MKMKWKQFVTHSLPRSWTKSKKRTPIKQQLDKVLNEDELNQNITYDVTNIVEVNKSLVTEDFCYLGEDNAQSYLKHNYILVNNLNVNDASSDKWSRQKHVITNESSDEISSEKIKNGNNHVNYHTVPKTCPYIYNNDSEEDRTNNDNNTIPKLRSRIKTNPWLPSPRITPNPSPSPSCSTSSYSSPTSSRSRSPHSTRSRSRSSSIDKAPLSTCSENADCSSNDISVASDITPDDVTNDDISKSEEDLKPQTNLDADTSISSGESGAFGFYESLDDLDFLPDLDQGLCDISPTSEPSFAYEEAFESQVENIKDLPMSHSNINSNCSSLDQLTGDYDKPVTRDPSTQIEAILKQRFRQSRNLETSDANHNIITKSDDAYTEMRDVASDIDNVSEYDNLETPQRMSETRDLDVLNFNNIATGHEDSVGYHSNEYSESEDEYYIDDVDSEDGLIDDVATDDFLDGILQNTDQEPLISPYQQPENEIFGACANRVNFSACPQQEVGLYERDDDVFGACADIPPEREQKRRSIGEIRESLEVKVMKLRKDKCIVEEKIRQAQEEDKIRMQEKLRFKQQVTLHRKQMLLRTLSDLRRRLEGQCQRLQVSYNGVLYMQRHSVSSSPQHRPLVNVDLGKEAPF